MSKGEEIAKVAQKGVMPEPGLETLEELARPRREGVMAVPGENAMFRGAGASKHTDHSGPPGSGAWHEHRMRVGVQQESAHLTGSPRRLLRLT